MYSTNGRKKPSKEEASQKVKSFDVQMICNKCGFVEQGRGPIFGEKTYCNSCSSGDVKFEYN